nr:hypothetical protein Iba_chr05bCG4610 [Ipomoea batatas]
MALSVGKKGRREVSLKCESSGKDQRSLYVCASLEGYGDQWLFYLWRVMGIRRAYMSVYCVCVWSLLWLMRKKDAHGTLWVRLMNVLSDGCCLIIGLMEELLITVETGATVSEAVRSEEAPTELSCNSEEGVYVLSGVSIYKQFFVVLH